MPPRAKEPQSLRRLVVRLKQQMNTLSTTPSATGLRDCERAAAAVEECLALLETGPTAVQLALNQTSISAAEGKQEEVKQMTDDAGAMLVRLSTCQPLPGNSLWQLMRPLLRLLLWLIPAHVPVLGVHPPPTLQQPPLAGAKPKAGWQAQLGAAYTRNVASSPLAQAVLAAVECAVSRVASIGDLELLPYSQASLMLEQSITLLTLVHRLYVLALELETDAGSSSSHNMLPAAATPGWDVPLPAMAKQAAALSDLGVPAMWWLGGINNLSCEASKEQPWASIGVSFAKAFKPSPKVANAVGALWSDPVKMTQRLAAMVGTLAVLKPSDGSREFGIYFHACNYNRAVLAFLKNGKANLQGPELADHLRCLPLQLEMHLRNLGLLYRLALGEARDTDFAQDWSHSTRIATHSMLALLAPSLAQLLTTSGTQPRMLIPPNLETPDSGDGFYRMLHMMLVHDRQAQIRAQQQHRHLYGAGSEEVSQWLSAADAAAQMLHLLSQTDNVSRCSLLLEDKGEGERLDIAHAALDLVRVLRPAPASAFTAGGPSSRAWACSLLVVAQLAAAWGSMEVTTREETEEGVLVGNVIALRLLIEEMLPVLSHVASLTTRASGTDPAEKGSCVSSIGGAVGTSPGGLRCAGAAGSQQPQGDLLKPGGSTGGTCVGRSSNSPYPADSTLQLLMAASRLLASSFRLALSSPMHYTVLAGGLQYLGSNTLRLSEGGSDDIVAALDAVLSLARELVMKGAWWQEAKAHHPVLLIETLYMVTKSLADVLNYATVMEMCCCHHDPGTCSCDVVLAHFIGWGGLASPQQCSGPSSSIATDAPTQPGMISGTTPTAVTTSTANTMNASSSSSSSSDMISNGSYQGQAGRQGRLNATSLVVTVVADLWSLLSDPSITGSAPRPAAWLLPTSKLLLDTSKHLMVMLIAIDSTLGNFIDARQLMQAPTSPTSSGDPTVGTVSTSEPTSCWEEAAVQAALELVSLVPHVAWSQLEAPVWSQPFIKTEAVHSHCMSGVRVVQPLLRAICVLNGAGLLTERHSRGVVAVLGGVPRCSSDTNSSGSHQSSLLLQEPSDLEYNRMAAGLSYADWSDILLLSSNYPTAARVTPLSGHLLQAFGERQLPAVAAYQRATPMSDTQPQAFVDSAVQERWDNLRGLGIFDPYLSWVQETLLLVINEVLSFKQPAL